MPDNARTLRKWTAPVSDVLDLNKDRYEPHCLASRQLGFMLGLATMALLFAFLAGCERV